MNKQEEENMKEEVASIIKGYCQGVYHLEFDEPDLSEMVERIVNLIKK